ncbi:helix-turn-helix domain-containing protein [uncultured Dysosmobacter sp.]|uniref:helix-turn-helix domain-containing protein n=1 Tax=uncultured Dysosmobacter sp. TaxID=2591384 RepID=UPI002606FD31|nr:helix-turn-helix transcriptional regulator [uncultured Dysosmobacter sp.]
MDKGSRIKTAREAKNLTQEELGTLCGTTKQTIFKYENNIVTNIPTDRLEKLAEVLGVTPAYLMGWETQLLNETIKENQSGRTTVKEEMSRLFGAKYSAADLILQGNKTAILYYKALDRRCAPELLDIISTVDKMSFTELENINLLVQAYLRADSPIREIVDTALKPYKQDGSFGEEIV